MMIPRVALSPFIGRESELAELQRRLNVAISGECQFVVLSGEPGVGKTRLLDEIELLAKARKLLLLHGRSIEQDGAFPYQGFCEAIQECFRQRDSTSLPSLIDLSDIAPDLVSLFPMLTEISDIRAAATGDSKLSHVGASQGPENRTQVFELLARTLTRLAGGNPLILFLEDLHAAEISIEALQYIVRRLGPTPTLIIGTYRSSEVDRSHPLLRMLESFRGDRRFSAIALEPFAPAEHRLFLETLIGGPKLSKASWKSSTKERRQRLFHKRAGPLITDSGGIAKDQTGAWSLGATTDLSTGDMPATIQQAVEKRIERLPEDLREVLSIASVIGRAFDFRDLEALAGSKDVEDSIDRLVEEGLLEEERESRGDRLNSPVELSAMFCMRDCLDVNGDLFIVSTRKKSSDDMVGASSVFTLSLFITSRRVTFRTKRSNTVCACQRLRLMRSVVKRRREPHGQCSSSSMRNGK
jgi:predicted ATPase